MTVKVIKGDDVDLTTIFNDQDGNPINITWYTVFLTVKLKSDININDDTDTDAKIKKNVTAHTSPLTGTTVIALSNTETDINVGMYTADLQLKDTGGKISSTQQFEFEILPEVTQRTS